MNHYWQSILITTFRVHGVLPSSELQKVLCEIIKLQRELHITLRDKTMKEQTTNGPVEDSKLYPDPELIAMNKQCENLRAQLGKNYK